MSKLFDSIRSFAIEDDGAQVIEYALIIAVVSIALILLLKSLNNSDFNTFIDRVGNCLSTNACP